MTSSGNRKEEKGVDHHVLLVSSRRTGFFRLGRRHAHDGPAASGVAVAGVPRRQLVELREVRLNLRRARDRRRSARRSDWTGIDTDRYVRRDLEPHWGLGHVVAWSIATIHPSFIAAGRPIWTNRRARTSAPLPDATHRICLDEA